MGWVNCAHPSLQNLPPIAAATWCTVYLRSRNAWVALPRSPSSRLDAQRIRPPQPGGNPFSAAVTDSGFRARDGCASRGRAWGDRSCGRLKSENRQPTGKDFDDSIPRIRAAEEGRPDATQRIENDHVARRIAQRDLRQIARRFKRGGSLTDMLLGEKARLILDCFPQLPRATRTKEVDCRNQRNPDSVQS